MTSTVAPDTMELTPLWGRALRARVSRDGGRLATGAGSNAFKMLPGGAVT